MKLLKRQKWISAFFFLVMCIILVPFQNCAPAKLGSSQVSVEKSQSSGLDASDPQTPTPIIPPFTPAPVAPRPVTPRPVAPAPVAPAPVAPAPVAPRPVAPRPVAPAPVAPAPVEPAPVAPAPENKIYTSCESLIEDLGSSSFTIFGDQLEQLPTSLRWNFYGKEQTRTERFWGQDFDPVALGLSVKFSAGNDYTRDPSSGLSIALGSGKSGYAETQSTGYPKSKPIIRFEFPRTKAFDDLNRGTISLFCNGKLFGTAFTYLPYANGPDKCKKVNGGVIDGSCHLGISCIDLNSAKAIVANTARREYYHTCDDAKPTLHNDCVKEFGESKGYVASCPLINQQEVPAVQSSSDTALSKVNFLFRKYRKRNPDSASRVSWPTKIEQDPSQLQALETLLQQP